ncbi:MAG: hypothetical protein WD069_17980 [Planctomycetales bacterium]
MFAARVPGRTAPLGPLAAATLLQPIEAVHQFAPQPFEILLRGGAGRDVPIVAAVRLAAIRVAAPLLEPLQEVPAELLQILTAGALWSGLPRCAAIGAAPRVSIVPGVARVAGVPVRVAPGIRPAETGPTETATAEAGATDPAGSEPTRPHSRSIRTGAAVVAAAIGRRATIGLLTSVAAGRRARRGRPPVLSLIQTVQQPPQHIPQAIAGIALDVAAAAAHLPSAGVTTGVAPRLLTSARGRSAAAGSRLTSRAAASASQIATTTPAVVVIPARIATATFVGSDVCRLGVPAGKPSGAIAARGVGRPRWAGQPSHEQQRRQPSRPRQSCPHERVPVCLMDSKAPKAGEVRPRTSKRRRRNVFRLKPAGRPAAESVLA